MSDDLLEPDGASDAFGSQRVWFIAGASHGLGRELVRAALERGDFVVATGRRPETFATGFEDYAHALVALAMDSDDAHEVRVAVDTAIRCFGHIDILVNNACASLIGAVEEASDLEVRRLFETNLFGVLNVMREVLPHMRERRRGHVVTLASSYPEQAAGFGLTHAVRGAVIGLSEALTQELKPLGIQVTTVDPGMLGGPEARIIARQVIADYDTRLGPARLWQEELDEMVMAGRAQAVLRAMDLPEAPGHLVLGARAYERALRRLTALQAELSAWRNLSLYQSEAA